MIRNLALDETELAVREMVSRRLAAGFAATADASARHQPAWAALAELSVLSAPLGVESGGLGGGLADAVLVLEPLGRCGVAVPFLDGICGPAALASRLPASDELAGLIEAAAAGGKPLAVAWVEPGNGWSRRPQRTSARRDADGWRLDGLKSTVRWAAQAAALLVCADCGGDMGIFLVPCGAPGVRLNPCPAADGHMAAEVVLEDALLPAAARLDAGDGQDALDYALDALAALSLAEAAGAMDACLEMTVGYLRTRQQFGAPLSRQQALQHRLADMYASCESAWSMAIDAATALAADVTPAERSARVSAAKAYVGPAGRRVGQEALQLHGAIGMTMEYPLGRLLARLTLIDLSFGDAGWHLDRLSRLLEDAA